MNLHAKCPNCKHENFFKAKAATRIEYAMKYGKVKTLIYKKCNLKATIQLNKIYAKYSKLAYLLASIIFIIGSIFILTLWLKVLKMSDNAMGLYAVVLQLLIPLSIYMVIEKQERIRVNIFNRTNVSEA